MKKVTWHALGSSKKMDHRIQSKGNLSLINHHEVSRVPLQEGNSELLDLQLLYSFFLLFLSLVILEYVIFLGTLIQIPD